nr:uncharacterized protein LOC111428932 [Onthophagus taurus]
MTSSEETTTLFTPTLKQSTRKRKLSENIDPNNIETSQISASSLLTSTLNDSISSKFENLQPFRPELSPSLVESSPASFSKYKIPPGSSPKLGSPERSRILYPNLNPTSKKRLYDFKRSSPAKKKLFNVKRSGFKDPVKFFCHTVNCEHVVKKILKCLDERDLYNCSRVSKIWKSAVILFETERFEHYKNDRIINKENYNASPNWFKNVSNFNQSTPISSISERTNCLTKGQHLQHCHSCGKPTAIVQQHISQCSRIACGFIICLKCNSCSSTGPENFKDACNSAMLVVEKPRKRRSLLDSPVRDENSTPFFLQNNNSISTLSSSGYGTELDSSNSHYVSGSFNKNSSYTLKNFNETSLKRISIEKRPSPVVPVIPVVNVKKLEPDYEPSSPPKVKLASICSKKSKKALRRL